MRWSGPGFAQSGRCGQATPFSNRGAAASETRSTFTEHGCAVRRLGIWRVTESPVLGAECLMYSDMLSYDSELSSLRDLSIQMLQARNTHIISSIPVAVRRCQSCIRPAGTLSANGYVWTFNMSYIRTGLADVCLLSRTQR